MIKLLHSKLLIFSFVFFGPSLICRALQANRWTRYGGAVWFRADNTSLNSEDVNSTMDTMDSCKLYFSQ